MHDGTICRNQGDRLLLDLSERIIQTDVEADGALLEITLLHRALILHIKADQPGSAAELDLNLLKEPQISWHLDEPLCCM